MSDPTPQLFFVAALPTKAGDKFVGDVVYDHCTKRRPDHITLVVESVSTAAFFTPIVDVSPIILLLPPLPLLKN